MKHSFILMIFSFVVTGLTAQVVNDITPDPGSWTGKRIEFVDSIQSGLGITYFDSTADAFFFTDSEGTVQLPAGTGRPRFINVTVGGTERLFFYGTGYGTQGQGSAFIEKVDTGFIEYIVDAVQINVYAAGTNLFLTGYNLNAIGWFNAVLFNLNTNHFQGFPQLPINPGGFAIESAVNADGTISIVGSPASVLDDSIWVFNPATLQLNATDSLPGEFRDSGVYVEGFYGNYWYGRGSLDFIYDVNTASNVFVAPQPAMSLIGEDAIRKNVYCVGVDTVGLSFVVGVDTTTGSYSQVWSKGGTLVRA